MALRLILVLAIGAYVGLAAETTSNQRTILVLGDSISAAYRIDTKAGWVSLLQQKLEDEHPHWQVVNASSTGDTTLDGLIKIGALLTEVKPDIMILELGANDGLRGYPVEDIRVNLIELIDYARAQGVYVLLAGMQLPQNYGPKYLDDFKNMYSKLAAAKGTGLIPFLMDGVATVEALMQNDGLHPNADGQPGMLENVWSVLSGLLDQPDYSLN